MKRAVYTIYDDVAHTQEEVHSMAAMQRLIAGIVIERGEFAGMITREIKDEEKPTVPPLRAKLRK